MLCGYYERNKTLITVMKISQLAAEFTKELESFVVKPIQMEPITAWNPKKAAAPERHIALGKRANISFESQVYALQEENQEFNRIESMLRIYLTSKHLEELTTPDVIKEQVWMFANTWLSIYCEMLTEPGILKSQFYNEDHDRFLNVLGGMLIVNPQRRLSFVSALRRWFPSSSLLLPSDDAFIEPISSAESSVSSPSVAVVATTPVSATSVVAEPPVAALRQNRLVLKRFLFDEGRNKTRKSPRS